MTAKKVALVGYRMGNISSLRNAFLALGTEAYVAESPKELELATHVVLPGVGAYPKAMENIHTLGFAEPLRRLALDERRPLLGICLGMQILSSRGEEHRVVDGLDIVPGTVKPIVAPGLPVPHVGWNETTATREGKLLGPRGARATYYYVHSYRFEADSPDDVSMTTDYGGPITAAIERGNVMGVQFHPEKSHEDGLALLRAFLTTG